MNGWMAFLKCRARFLLWAACAVGVLGVASPVQAETRMQVGDEANVRRTCPSIECGAIGRFYPGESVVVYESVGEWSRVSGYYDAGCNEGRSAFVDSGASACTEANGIVNGEFAEWLRSDFLLADRVGRAG